MISNSAQDQSGSISPRSTSCQSIKQCLDAYQHSERSLVNLSALAVSLEEALLSDSACGQDNPEHSNLSTLRTIQTELGKLSDTLPDDALLTGLLASWQARVSQTPPERLSEPYNATTNNAHINALDKQPLTALSDLITSQASYTPASWWQVIVLSFVVWVLVKLPQWGDISIMDNFQYYSLVAPALVSLGVASYFVLSQKQVALRKAYWLGALIVYGLILLVIGSFFDWSYFDRSYGDTYGMIVLHSPIVLISLVGAVMYSHALRSWRARVAYLQYLGELGVLSILILFGGIILTVFTMVLFNMSGNRGFEEWYTGNIVPLGIVATPLVASHLYFTVFKERSRLSSILLQVFSPLCALTFLAYLVNMIYMGTSPVEDRDALIVVNGLLIVIWVMSVFHIIARKSAVSDIVTGTGLDTISVNREGFEDKEESVVDSTNDSMISSQNSHFGFMDILTAFMLVVVSLFNIVILYSMFGRFILYGFTLNRFIVIGVNVLIFTHLCQIGFQYFQLWRHTYQSDVALKKSIVNYLPVYSLWSLLIVFMVAIKTLI